MKKAAISIVLLLGMLFCVLKAVEWRVESKFQERINSNPDRAYDIHYSDFDLDTFFRGVTLDDVSILPINTPSGSAIRGEVDYATVNGLVLTDLFFGEGLIIDEIAFVQPKFEVILSNDTIRKTGGKELQEMFGDILSRAELNSFRIQNGSVTVRNPITQDIKAQIKQINIEATEIETDSVKFKHLIPFEVGNLSVDIEGATFKPNDYTDISLGSLHYNLMDKEILLNDISLGYAIDWVEVSKRLGFQNDIIELYVKEIGIHQIEPSKDFYTQLEIVAHKLSVDEMDIKLYRNKNMSRPRDTKKPVFQGIINSIPLEVLIDSVQISNSSITYTELGVKKSESGSIKIEDINGSISGITNMPEKQMRIGQLEAKLDASLLGKAEMNVELMVPYTGKTFSLAVAVGEMEMTSLNPTLRPLAGVETASGQIKKIQFLMNAGPVRSSNKLIFDYSNLNLKLLGTKKKNKAKKKALLSALVNGAIRPTNLPGQKKYITAKYRSSRNVYRSPIHYIIQGLIQGITRIVPGRLAKKFILKN